jgi:large subunit ribosomal protein L17
MRHAKSGNRLSRNQTLRKATMRDMARAILVEERIFTTKAKAKEARKFIDQLITLGKKGTLADKRRAFSILCDHTMVKELFEITAPRFASRVGGYTRIIPFGLRRGDNAEMVYLELTEKSKAIISEGRLRGAFSHAPVESDVATVAEAETAEAPAAKPAKETKPAKKEAAKKEPAKKETKKEEASKKEEAPKKAGGIRKLFKKKEDK